MTPPSDRRLRTALTVIAVVLAVACLGGAGGGYWLIRTWQAGDDAVRAAAEEFIAELTEADYRGAYERLCARARDQYSPEAFERAVRGQPRIRSHRIVDVSMYTVDGHESALVNAELTYDDAATERHTFPLSRDGGDWQVCGQPY